jgi:hypothetical protein
MPITACWCPSSARTLEQGVQKRQGRFSPLQPKAFLADVLGLQEPLERLGRVQLGEDMAVLLRFEVRGGAFDVMLDPPFLLGLHDVHVLDADRTAVSVSQQ